MIFIWKQTVMSLAQGLRSHEHVSEVSNTPEEKLLFLCVCIVIKQLWVKSCLLYRPNFPNNVHLLSYRAKSIGYFHRWTFESVCIIGIISNSCSLIFIAFI